MFALIDLRLTYNYLTDFKECGEIVFDDHSAFTKYQWGTDCYRASVMLTRDVDMGILSVRPSVCLSVCLFATLSHVCIVLTRLYISSKYFRHVVGSSR